MVNLYQLYLLSTSNKRKIKSGSGTSDEVDESRPTERRDRGWTKTLTYKDTNTYTHKFEEKVSLSGKVRKHTTKHL